MHGMRLALGALLVVRAFELWTHENDIRGAAGWAASVPDTSHPAPGDRTRRPAAAVRRGPGWPGRAGRRSPRPDRAGRRDLGPAGARGRDAPARIPAAVLIVTDAAGFCRLAANRVTPADLDLHVTGDPGHVAAVLAAASTLALD